MSYITPEFIVFFAVVMPLYFAVPSRWRWLYLLAASGVFYFYGAGSLILLLLASTLADYAIARSIAGAASLRQRRGYLLLSIAHNLGALIFFKYSDALGAVFTGGPLAVALPLGISFYTFTKLAYTVDVYRGIIQPEQHIGRFATFVTFFPNVTSGPIERAGHLLPQIKNDAAFDDQRVVEGLRRILWGVFKKVVIADHLAIYVNTVYGQPQDYGGMVLIIATMFLAFQIYADFSGYTDIALGTARIMGIELFENFRQPYFAVSVLDFWRRWHMSLTSWIRDYMFLPLSRYLLRKSSRRFPRLIEAFVYLVVMSLVGLWHGETLTFLIWGGLHGLYMGAESVINVRRLRLLPQAQANTLAKIVITFGLVSFAWIFFRAQSLTDALYIITHLFDFTNSSLGGLSVPFTGAIESRLALGLGLGLVLLLLAVDLLDAHWGLNQALARAPGVLRWSLYYGTTTAILVSLILATNTPNFIYFQF